jgi:short-subunit dehydrogenase
MLIVKEKILSANKIDSKLAVVTGGSGRIGSLFVQILLNSGTKVICLSRSSDKFLKLQKMVPKHQKTNLEWICFDLNKKNTIINATKIIKKNFSKLDLLINNASSSYRGENYIYSYKTITDEFFNVFGGAVLLTESLISLLRKNKNSKIINVGSLWAIKAPNQKIYGNMQIGPSALTSAGKSAIINYSNYLAVREAKYLMSVNSLIPGWFPRKGKVENKKYINKIKNSIPLKRIGKLENLISPISFLLSSGSSYYTGQNLIVDGGYTSW